jgi:hypothetical protein
MMLPELAADAFRPARPAKQVEIRAAFSCHAFTRISVPGDGPENRYRLSGEGRCFCPDRYSLSQLLPDIVRTIGSRKCRPAKRQNLMLIDEPYIIPPGSEYRVFFDLRPTNEAGALLLYVQSAYAAQIGRAGAEGLEGSGLRAQPVSVRVMVSQALAEQNRAL